MQINNHEITTKLDYGIILTNATEHMKRDKRLHRKLIEK